MKLLYFSYLIKVTDFKKLNEFINFVSKKKQQSKTKTVQNMLRDFWKYNTAFSDYFFFEFYDKTDDEKKTYTSTWYMYKFQRRMNDPAYVPYFQDKVKFYQKFKNYVNHSHFLPEGKMSEDLKVWLTVHNPSFLIAKNSQGQVGSGIEKFKVDQTGETWIIGGKDLNDFLAYAKTKQLNLIETFIQQHDFLQHIAPSALSTIRVITILDQEGKVNIEGAILRMSAGKAVDNYDAGGVSAAIDVHSGKIIGPVQYKDPRKTGASDRHPISGAQVTEFVMPEWDAILKLVNKAALVIPQVRTVGWDVVLTIDGPSLLEGNHNWDKTHWQKSYGKGMKEVLEPYL